MGSEVIELTFKPASTRRTHKQEVESALLAFSVDQNAYEGEAGVRFTATKAAFTMMCDNVQDSAIETLFSTVENLGGSKAKVWCFPPSSDPFLYAKPDGNIVTFPSEEPYKTYQAELSAPVGALTFDYGRKRENKTALLRLQIKVKTKRAKVVDLFSQLIDNTDQRVYENFREEFAALTKSKTHIYRWCAMKWANFPDTEKNWYGAPPEIAHGVRFVKVDGEYVYVGFDLKRVHVEKVGPRWLEEANSYMHVISALEGVKKVWLKVRPMEKTREETFTYFPNPAEDYFVLEQPLSDDNDWTHR